MSWKEWRAVERGDLAVIGDPIAHSLSPVMQNAALRHAGLSWGYQAVRVPLEEFDEALGHLAACGLWGLNVTVPIKEAAFAWCTDVDPRLGAANTLDLRTPGRGTNTDAPGFMDTLAELGVQPCRAVVLGAGGSARAVAVALCDAGFQVALHNRTSDRARALRGETGLAIEILEEPVLTGGGLVVNATSAGLGGEAPYVAWETAEPGALAYDLMYGPAQTAFCEAAEARGLRSTDGLAMLVAQGARSFTWWLDIPAPRQAMMRALDEHRRSNR
ncbi:MAG: shikimate dehydrogenase [Fimbriimonadaceae bacterium]|nr:shikimate dehydrogenase [Fimbriimonadaceae bacterium]QYK56022.1 MAG: shikimate dehydrogenase [Fimbriimonadaceae bacterium]